MQNIGDRLEEARKRKGISIREAAEATKVRGDYLHKFESSQFDINLPDIYVRGFLRNYATFLGLPAEKIVNDYNALGHGAPAPKSVNREIYGRMDLSVSSSKDTARESADIEPEAAPGESDSDNPATFKPRPGALPYVDKALLIKGGAIVAAVVAIVLIVVVGVRAWSGSKTETPVDTPAATAATDPQIVIHALDSVRVKVVEEASGVELFQGAITRGDSRTFPKNGSLFLTADPMENIEVELDGKRTNISTEYGLRGRQRVRVE
ncbi:helix-turn-helix domain-containing protein [Synoicihabitans lomoniglobus]|uniref:Helix-turn-helix domain-containing protein n=1 Tax=Synoicihabitans lomoniglobus TaxID=2909285 RepID=A0AAE9ZTU5_9BACT|nr:helix-turn-helix domain-containing protein [Opitutaceae bacterium LMO-M01]WED63987.1 helix-turn-helix domain-containing protein [Opitutaceae bacterium LMO-M01]